MYQALQSYLVCGNCRGLALAAATALKGPAAKAVWRRVPCILLISPAELHGLLLPSGPRTDCQTMPAPGLPGLLGSAVVRPAGLLTDMLFLVVGMLIGRIACDGLELVVA